MTYSIRRIRRGAAALLALALCASSAPASADDVGNEPLADAAEWSPVAETELVQRGTGTPPMLAIDASTSSSMNALVLGNLVGENSTTGNVSIGDNAISGMNGFGQYVFNTGHNNSIQTNLIVILNLD